MKVFIVNPPTFNKQQFIKEGRCMQVTASWGSLWMPLTLAYIAAVLRKENHEVTLTDCFAEKMNMENVIDLIYKLNPELIVLNTSFPSIKDDMKTASIMKNSFRNVKIVAVGMYPTLLKDKIMEDYKNIDFAIVGEPEWAIKDLANSLKYNGSLRHINGLIFREKNKIIVNKNQDLNKNDLDELPFPARDLLNNDAYRHVHDNGRFTLLNTARGCPYKCIFCNVHNYYGNKCRKRKVSSVIEEIAECVERYRIKNFLFWDEGYTLDKEYMSEIADAIINNGFIIKWFTRTRADNLDSNLLRKMKQSGCSGISLGIESVNQKVLDVSKKGVDFKQIDRAIGIIKNSGISVGGHFVFGLPGDTMESANSTIKFAVNSSLDFAQFYCAVPYPDTELGKMAIKNNWIETTDYSQYHLAESVMKNGCLTTDDIKKLRNKAYKAFYKRKKMYRKLFSMFASNKTFSNFYRLFIDTLGFRKWTQ